MACSTHFGLIFPFHRLISSAAGIDLLHVFQLLTLAVDNYKQLSNTKDMLKAGENIFRLYLGANSVSLLLLRDFYLLKRSNFRSFVYW